MATENHPSSVMSEKSAVLSNIPNKQIITITDKAIKMMTHLLENQKDVIGIRVNVRSGGCSGFAYVIEYAKFVSKYDEVIDLGSFKVLIDYKASMYLIGTEMDYVDDTFKSGFVFNNPNETGKCGCGKSFSM